MRLGPCPRTGRLCQKAHSSMEGESMGRKDLGQPLDLKEAIGMLVQSGFRIVIDDLGEYDGYEIWIRRTEGMKISQRELDMFVKDGWLETYGAHGYQISDEGRKAWLRSTDELGDGKLVPPNSGEGQH